MIKLNLPLFRDPGLSKGAVLFYRVFGFRKILINWIFFCTAGLVLASSSAGLDLSLITPEELSGSLKSYTIIDARPMAEWKKGHIPGALSFSWENYTEVDKNIPFRVLPPESMAAALGEKGVSHTAQVVVYGDADSSWGGEGWVCWVLSWLGHKGRVRLLSGGFQGWKAKSLIVDRKGFGKIRASSYSYNLNSRVFISTSEVAGAAGSTQIVDTRSFFERLKGRIPGSVHINWKKFFKGKENVPIGREEFVALMKSKGIKPEKPVVYYCSGGIRSAYVWTVHSLSGFSNAYNYEGGMEAWSRQTP